MRPSISLPSIRRWRIRGGAGPPEFPAHPPSVQIFRRDQHHVAVVLVPASCGFARLVLGEQPNNCITIKLIMLKVSIIQLADGGRYAGCDGSDCWEV